MLFLFYHYHLGFPLVEGVICAQHNVFHIHHLMLIATLRSVIIITIISILQKITVTQDTNVIEHFPWANPQSNSLNPHKNPMTWALSDEEPGT